MKCLVSRACCLSFCSSAWQKMKDMDKFHSVTAQTRTAGPRIRCTVYFSHFPLMFCLTRFDHSHKQNKLYTCMYTQPVKKSNAHYSDHVYSMSCAPGRFPSFFYMCVTGLHWYSAALLLPAKHEENSHRIVQEKTWGWAWGEGSLQVPAPIMVRILPAYQLQK